MNFITQLTSQADQQKIEQLFKETETDVDKKLPHSVFMDLIATNPKHKNRQDLDHRDPRCEEIIKDCNVQFLKDHIQRRRKFMVSEDKTHSIFQKPYSLKLLVKALKPIIAEKDPSLMYLQYFEDQVKENPDRQDYFIQKGLSESEAFACALALSFYTGYGGYGTHTSYRTNRGASEWAKTANKDVGSGAKDYMPILHYTIKALAYIPYYWGTCIRYVDLTEDEEKRYQVGSIVSWIQFTSSTKVAGEGVSYFSGRNTVLHIFSISGRYIQPFSNFPAEEEVLFAPWCNFLVVKKEEIDEKTHIYLRQVELGTSKNTILWVDDKIMDEQWENKALMEALTTQGLEKNLRIIPKISTNLALAFADSPFGQYIVKYLPDNFQIITDMGRPEEENGGEAGAILIKALRERGFKHKFTVYCFNKENAQNALVKHVGNMLGEPSNYAVITSREPFLEFVRLQTASSKDEKNCAIF